MNEPAPRSLIDHDSPDAVPRFAYVLVPVPMDFNAVIVRETQRAQTLYAEQLLAWAQKGADCERLHGTREVKPKWRKRR
jgi:hypothetical protein